MAWFIPGRTKCAVCGKIIYKGEDKFMFPYFVKRGSVFDVFNDTVLHPECFDNYELKHELREFARKLIDPNDKQWRWFLDYLDELIDYDELN